VRNLEVCLRDETLPLKDDDINDCFKPYARSLLTLSAHHYYETSLRETGKQQSYIEYLGNDCMSDRWSKRYENNGIAITVEKHGNSVTAVSTFTSGFNADMHCYSFPELEDFFTSVTYGIVVGACQGYDETSNGEKYCFVKYNYGKDMSCMEKRDYDRLKKLITDLVKNSEYIKVRDEAKTVYGGI